MRKQTKKIYFIFFWIVLIVSFVFFSGLLILVANGYHLNLKTFSLQRTGMIILDGNQNGFTLTVNGKEKLTSFPVKLNRLFPGRYEITIAKENYQPWSKVLNVEGGQAVLQENIILFLKEAKIRALNSSEANQSDLQNSYNSQSKDLKIQGNEIWYLDKLITRFSQNVDGAILDSDLNHIYVQIGNQIRMIEIDGSNDTLLISLPKNDKTVFSLFGGKIRYLEDSTIYEAIVR